MGRIKTTLAKRATHRLFREHAALFTRDFSKNKLLVVQMIETKSKKLVNVITGYVTRLASAKKSYKTL